MRVFVTGGSGFIGRHLLPLLEGHEVLCLSHATPAAVRSPTMATVVGDLHAPSLFAAELERFAPECCLHLAWSGLPDYSLANCRRNLVASIGLFDILNRSQCRIVVAGTCWEYGSLVGALAESAGEAAPNLFGAFKSGLRTIGTSMCDATGGRLVWARIFFAYGPGQRPASLIPSCYRCFRQGVPPNITNPGSVNDFIHVADVAAALRRFIERDVAAGIYNIGSGQPATVEEVVNLVAAHLGRPPVPPRGAAARGSWADVAKMMALGWRPQYTLETGVLQTLLALDAER
jgi:nucleoside-diphosphate-sugar epimerase